MEFFQPLSFVIIYLALPTVAIIVLIYLILLLKQLINTLKRVDNITVDLEHKLAKLDTPIETIVSVVDGFNRFTGIVSTAVTGFAGFSSFKNRKNNRSKRNKGGMNNES